MRVFFLLICLSGSFFWIETARAKEYAYPAKGQSPEKQQKDESDCRQWAIQQTGYDPSQASASTASAPQGQRVKGAARGAAGGAAIGAIAGDAGKGAAIGATAGAMRGGAQQRRSRREAQATQQETQAQQAEFNKAHKACLEGRGYTVE